MQLVGDKQIKKPQNDGGLQQQKEHRLIRYSAWLTLIAVVLLAAWMRYGLLDVPLERDEGEYAYGGQLILRGLPLYQHLYSLKLPGIYAAYAGLIALFGQTHRGIHFGLLLINAATIVLVFLLTKRLANFLSASVAAASFAVLSISQTVQGIFANAEHFVILPAVGGILLLLKGLEEDLMRLVFLSGLLLGLGFIIKQHGVLFVALGGFYILIAPLLSRKVLRKRLTYRFLLYSMGAVLPYGLICMTFYLTGWFERFWFLTVEYAKIYSSQNTIDVAWVFFKAFATPIGRSSFPIWILSGIGLTALLWDRRFRQRSILILMFFIFSFLAVCPTFYFRPHYFILVLPSVALLSGIAVSAIANGLFFFRSQISQYALPILLAVVCLVVSVYQQRRFLFQMTPIEACRAVYQDNPFPESLVVASFVQSHTHRDERIAVIGSEPQIYFYSNRLSASSYVYMYPLMEKHDFALQMQKEMIQQIVLAQPKLLIFINHNFSWLMDKNSKKLIFKWLAGYLAKYYRPVGLVDMLKEKTHYYWGSELKVSPQSKKWIAIHERKT